MWPQRLDKSREKEDVLADNKDKSKIQTTEASAVSAGPEAAAAAAAVAAAEAAEAAELAKLQALMNSMPDELSTDEMDALLSQEDPEFLKSLSGIAGDKDLSLFDVNLTEEENAIAEEIQLWQSSKGFKRFLYLTVPFLPHISYRLKKLKFKLLALFHSFRVRLKNFIYFLATDGKDKTIGALKNGIKDRLTRFNKSRREFTYLPLRIKGIFALIVIGLFGLSFFVYRSLTKGVIPKESKTFIESLDSVADVVYEFDPLSEVEPFYDNLRASSNLILLPKIVVNLLRSKGSGDNPMAALEFFVEGMIPEVVVEIKDREVAIREVMHRTLEESTYDELESPEGKQAVQDKLVQRMNQILTTGKARRVFLKTIVLKP